MAKPLPPHSTYTLIEKRGEADCAIACLAMFLQRDYEEVLLAAARVRGFRLDTGLYCKDMLRIAKRFGVRGKWIKNYDLDDATGILWIGYTDEAHNHHAVLLVEGNVVDPNPPIRLWDDVNEYVDYYSAVAKLLFVRVN